MQSKELLEQFGGDVSTPPIEQLAALHQVGPVDDFVNDFRARATQIPDLTPHVQLGLLLNGFKEEIRVCIHPNDVLDLRMVMKGVHLVERELEFKEVRTKIFEKYFVRVKGRKPEEMRSLSNKTRPPFG